MSDPELQFLEIGSDAKKRNIALRFRPSQAKSAPTLVWLNGLRSDMGSTKASALDAWCAAQDRALMRFDYSGHGASSGRFEAGALSLWLEETLGVLDTISDGPLALVGSSMGGYLALLAARALHGRGQAERLKAMVLIAPAVDMTHALMASGDAADAQAALARDGVWMRPSAYGEAMPITRALIDDGAQHLLLGGTVRSYCPTRILQGMLDAEVPWRHAVTLVEHMPLDPVTLTLVRDGEHRLSRQQDLQLLFQAVRDIA